MFRKIGVNFASGLSARIILIVVTFVATPVMLQKMGAEGYGVITLLLAILGFGGLLDLGFGQSLVHVLSSSEENDKQTHYSTAIRIFLTLGLAGAAILIVFSETIIEFLLNGGSQNLQIDKTLIILVAISLPIKMISALFSSVLHSEEMMHADNIAQTVSNIFRFGFIAVLASFGYSLTIVSASIPISLVLTAMIQMVYMKRVIWLNIYSFHEFSKASSKLLSNTALGLFVNRATGELALHADKFIIAGLMGVGALAPYTIAYLIIARINDFGFLVSSITFPRLVKLITTNQKKHAFHLCLICLCVLILFGLLASLLIFHFGEWFLAIWLNNPNPGDIYDLVLIFMIGALFSLPNWVTGNILIAINRTKLLALITMIPSIFSVALCWSLTSQLGLMGAAWSWSLGYAAITVCLAIAVYRLWVKKSDFK